MYAQSANPAKAIAATLLLSVAILGYVVHTRPPSDVGIELTSAQASSLDAAYRSGFPNPNDDDPCERLRMLPQKTLKVWRKQFRKRGFTVEKIQHMLKKGRRERFTHPQKPGTPKTKIYDEKGNWIVVDFADCILYQVAPHNFK